MGKRRKKKGAVAVEREQVIHLRRLFEKALGVIYAGDEVAYSQIIDEQDRGQCAVVITVGQQNTMEVIDSVKDIMARMGPETVVAVK